MTVLCSNTGRKLFLFR